jgi:hypothetical protein
MTVTPRVLGRTTGTLTGATTATPGHALGRTTGTLTGTLTGAMLGVTTCRARTSGASTTADAWEADSDAASDTITAAVKDAKVWFMETPLGGPTRSDSASVI